MPHVANGKTARPDDWVHDYNINLAIVSCIKNPTNFKFWIDYHINKCNVKKIFLRVQDSPELVGLLENYRNIIEPTYVNNDSKFTNSYFLGKALY